MVGFYSIHCDSWICWKCQWNQLSINTKGQNQGTGIDTFTKAIADSLTKSTEPLRLFYGHHMWATCLHANKLCIRERITAVAITLVSKYKGTYCDVLNLNFRFCVPFLFFPFVVDGF
eukprot:TRINITY_DN13425_c2_g1_i1.p2 TRINITY_DN13425_c2_g1~~TRINITY_DN13425_c2_g1_i1.p2  ORF type:complete len:117 (-),score=3.51 TRINITY_DN13425_c2_g1_i1:177-527(-)